MTARSRTVFAVFCDDIRQEVGNKQSWIGIYSGNMVVPQFPIVLAKLCTVVQVNTPFDHPLRRLRLYAKMNEVIVFEQELQELVDAQNALAQSEDRENAKNRFHTYNSAIVASPIQIEVPSVYQIFVDTEIEGEGLRSRKLFIVSSDSEKETEVKE